MNPRQRRGLLLLGIAFVGAVAVFAAVAGYVADVRSEVEPKTTVFVLERPVAAYSPIDPGQVTEREVPRKWMPARALRTRTQLLGKVAATDLPRGAELQEGMLVPPPTIEPGQREISILISAETGVAGKLRPNDVVDIHATFAGDRQSVSRSRVVIPSARIITVGVPRDGDSDGQDATEQVAGRPEQTVVPVTFALTPREVLRLTHAESFAEEVRLALVRPGDVIQNRAREYSLPPSRRKAPQ